MSTETVTIIDDATGKKVQLPLLSPTSGPKTIDISTLYKELGYFTYDPGFVSTASCSSGITFLDGNKGVLQSLLFVDPWRFTESTGTGRFRQCDYKPHDVA